MWTKTQLAYFAGIIDGEGCICIYARTHKNKTIDYFPRLQMMNTSKELLEWVTSNIGGMVVTRLSKNPKWKTRYEWYTQRHLMDKIAPAILPYIVIKKRQIEILIEFRNTFNIHYGSKGVPEEVYKTRHNLITQLKSLNKRGPLPSPMSPSA